MDSPFVRQAVVRAVHGSEMAFMQDLFASNSLPAASNSAKGLMKALAANAYRSSRPDVTSTEPAPSALSDLLELVASRKGEHAWQQIAMLKGFQSLVGRGGFVPARMTSAPAVFADATVGEDDPLWKARLAGRRAFTWPGDELALGLTPLSPGQMQLVEQGKAFYVKCAACHGEDGRGVTGLAPALGWSFLGDGSARVAGANYPAGECRGRSW